MRALVITNRRSVRTIEVRTGEHGGKPQIYMQAHWQDESGVMRPSGAPLWIPAASLDEVVAAMIAAGNEINRSGGAA